MNVKIKGTKSGEFLRGTIKNDVICGGRGADILDGRDGADILKGGKGKDTFIVSEVDSFDYIKDFQPGKDKVLLVAGLFEEPQVINPYEVGSQVSVVHGVVQYEGAPVVFVGDAPLAANDLLLT